MFTPVTDVTIYSTHTYLRLITTYTLYNTCTHLCPVALLHLGLEVLYLDDVGLFPRLLAAQPQLQGTLLFLQ